MVKEIALIVIDPKEAREFEQTYVEVAPVLRRQPGYRSDELLRVLENEAEYVLIVEWDGAEDHENFVKSEDFHLLADPWGPFQKEIAIRHGSVVSGSG
jgi:heme-degrading monooxygenase HmoA